MQDRLTIRNSQRSAPLINRIEEIAKQRNFGKVTPALLDILELGLKSYDAGYRFVDGKLLTVEQLPSIVSIEKEVAKSLYGQLAGEVVNLEYYEEEKPQPDKKKLEFYLLIRKALRIEQSGFYRLTVEQAIARQNNFTSPILLALRSVDTPEEAERIIFEHEAEFLELIQKTGVNI